MTDQSRVELLVVEWEQARDRGTPLTPEQVCAADPRLLPAVWEMLLRLYPDLDDTRPQEASDTDAKTTRQGQTQSPPMMIGEYRVIRRIGAGGMGEVYEAEDPHLGRRVAIKVMQPKLFADPVARDRFLREARAQAAVQHDHVAVIHDVKQAADGTPFLVLPLLRGETLADRLKRQGGRPLPIPDALRIGRQIAEGLAAAHTKGLVHRDVKPSNVWLDAAGGQVKVLDFGLARWLDPEGYIQQGTPAGTLPYMPPEQLLGGTLDQRADLYSLGAVLFEMCTGRRAIDILSIPSMSDAVLYQVPPLAHTLNPIVPEQLSKVITALLAKEATARTPDAAAGVAAVLRVLESGSDPTTTLAQTVVTAPNRRWPLYVAGAIGIALIAGLIVLFAVRQPATPAPASASPTPLAEPASTGALLVTAINVRPHDPRDDGAFKPLHLLGKDNHAATTAQAIVVDVAFTRPAYSYVVLFRADGGETLLDPQDETDVPVKTDRPRYPSKMRDKLYLLDDGPGLWAVGVIASDDPLPSYREWRTKHPGGPWRPHPAPPPVVVFDDGQLLTTFGRGQDGQRGGRGQVTDPARSPVTGLVDWLKAQSDVAAAVGFPVTASE